MCRTQESCFYSHHESCRFLDLFITRKDCDFSLGLPVAEYYISDHSFVLCDLLVSKPDLEVKDIKYRKYKAIELDAFSHDLSESELCNKSFSDLDELVSCYQDTLSRLIDKHAPEKSKRIVVRPKQPWYNDNVDNVKRARRKCERRWLKMGFETDLLAFKKARMKFTNCLSYRDVNIYLLLSIIVLGIKRSCLKLLPS